MNRRRALLLAGTLGIAAAAAAVAFLRPGPAPPDIVLIVWDTCRADRVTVNGYPRPTTPRLADLAARGVTFRNCFTPSPWTPPAHASLFTGLLPRRHGLREGVGDRVSAGIPLLAQTLSDAGYETEAVVANPFLSWFAGLLEGFDQAVGCWNEDNTHGTATEVRNAVEGWIRGKTGARSADRKPYFLFVNLMDCHLPYRFEEGIVAEVRGDGAVNAARNASRAVTPQAAHQHLAGVKPVDPDLVRGLDPAYDGAVRTDDRSTGKILDALKAAGLLENAVVVVTGDHGENLGEHGLLDHLLSVHETVLHVPLVVSWPGRFEGGRVEDAQVRLQDLYPTLLEAAGVAVPAPCGKDARTLLEAPLRSRTLVAEYGPPIAVLEAVRALRPDIPPEVVDRHRLEWLAVRDPLDAPEPRKYVRVVRHLPWGEVRPEREELYDLRSDPGEERNLLGPGAPPAERAAAERLGAQGK